MRWATGTPLSGRPSKIPVDFPVTGAPDHRNLLK
jgi:hypothetical protein